MQFEEGNQFWQMRSSHGRKPIFENPDQLLEAAYEYFDWVSKNPLWEDKLVIYQGYASHEPVARMRAMTIEGLCNFLDISVSSWKNYRKNPDFLPVVTQVEQIIRQQKFEGASADLLNANIIARDLGLADRKEHSGADGGPIQVEQTSAVDKLTAILDAKSSRQTGDAESE